jgi:lipoprotein signal peptidase
MDHFFVGRGHRFFLFFYRNFALSFKIADACIKCGTGLVFLDKMMENIHLIIAF